MDFLFVIFNIFLIFDLKSIDSFPNIQTSVSSNANLVTNSIILSQDIVQNVQRLSSRAKNIRNDSCNMFTNRQFFSAINSQRNEKYLSTGKNRQNQKVFAQSMENKRRQNLLRKTHFDYANQLAIMLANKSETERVRMATISALGGEFQRGMQKFDGSPIYALTEALATAKQLAEQCAEMSEAERILKIAGALWKGSKKFKETLKKEQVEERVQLRFIGLVLWHLAVRESPVPDSDDGDELVFIAKMRPNIDAHDPEWQRMLWEFDQQLDAMVGIPEEQNEGKKEQNEGKKEQSERKKEQNEGKKEQNEGEKEQMRKKEQNEAEKALMKELLEQIGKGEAVFGDREKYAELNKKFRLMARNNGREAAIRPICVAFRPFLVFGGSDTADILLFVRALLEGHFNAKTMDEYLERGSEIAVNSFLLTTHGSLRRMTIQLLTVVGHF